jgi:hypothetical protein
MGDWKQCSAILDLGNGWSWLVGLQYPLSRRMVGTQSQSGHCGVEKISCSCWESKPSCPAHSPLQYLLGYPGSVCTNCIPRATSWQKLHKTAFISIKTEDVQENSKAMMNLNLILLGSHAVLEIPSNWKVYNTEVQGTDFIHSGCTCANSYDNAKFHVCGLFTAVKITTCCFRFFLYSAPTLSIRSPNYSLL